MARGGMGAFSRILFLVLLIAVLCAGGALWFDYLGVIDVKDTFAPAFSFFGLPVRTPSGESDSPVLLETERIGKMQEELALRIEDLQKQEEGLTKREQEVLQQISEIEEQRKSLQDQEKSLNEQRRRYDDRIKNIEQNAKNLNGMPPAKAVAILQNMDDQDMIDHLRMVEELAQRAGADSTVAYWLSLMPAERAAVIQKKMAMKPRA